MADLTDRQREVLTFIRHFLHEHGYPPTMRDIAAGFGFRSTNAAAAHVSALEKKGAIRRDGSRSRGIVLCDGPSHSNVIPFPRMEEPVSIPILGSISAGLPLMAEENVDETLMVDPFFTGGRRDQVFGLVVSGESMIDAGIRDGDYIFVRAAAEAQSGQIVVAMVDGETTCKYYFPERHHIRLQPANSSMAPILWYPEDATEFQVLGVVIGVYRRV